MKTVKWLMISYTLPSEPSRYRVAAWRKLKRYGAVNLQQSLWILPDTNEANRILEKLSQEIQANGGESFLVSSEFLGKEQEQAVIGEFNKMREEEYLELIRECKNYLQEVRREIKNEKFIFAELEEEEHEFEKLASWYEKIVLRDRFTAPSQKKAHALVEKSREILETFSQLVFIRNEK